VPELALAWVLAQGDHVVAIPGTTRIDHLEQNLRARSLLLPAATMARLSELFAPAAVAGTRYSKEMQQSIDTECFEFERFGD
jgi:aryl-alcohol dehydrogenase-like predicted oxidoreductase